MPTEETVRAELRQAKDRVKTLEKSILNLQIEIGTIDVLMQHMLADLRENTPVRVAAAVYLGETIQRVSGFYR